MLSHYHDPALVAAIERAIARSTGVRPLLITHTATDAGDQYVVESADAFHDNYSGLVVLGSRVRDYVLGTPIRKGEFTKVGASYAIDWRLL